MKLVQVTYNKPKHSEKFPLLSKSSSVASVMKNNLIVVLLLLIFTPDALASVRDCSDNKFWREDIIQVTEYECSAGGPCSVTVSAPTELEGVPFSSFGGTLIVRGTKSNYWDVPLRGHRIGNEVKIGMTGTLKFLENVEVVASYSDNKGCGIHTKILLKYPKVSRAEK